MSESNAALIARSVDSVIREVIQPMIPDLVRLRIDEVIDHVVSHHLTARGIHKINPPDVSADQAREDAAVLARFITEVGHTRLPEDVKQAFDRSYRPTH